MILYIEEVRLNKGGQPEASAQVKYICTKGLKIEEVILNIGGQSEARAQVEGPQVKYICLKGLTSLLYESFYT